MGHGLFLVSRGRRSYTTALNRFTGHFIASDPLQTLFQPLSCRIPVRVLTMIFCALCCGNEKWGDWRPHLAVMLSSETGNPSVQQKAIIKMARSFDQLMFCVAFLFVTSRGLTHATHLCYLTAHGPHGVFTQKVERLVFVSSSHRQPFECLATNSAIH
ncbi:LOW QUALITY PROTEIN: protein transport protein Sec16B [Menidia menidia]